MTNEDGQTLTVIRDGALRLREYCPIKTLESGREPHEGRNTMTYRGADMSLARLGRKQANISVRITWISFGALSCRKKKPDDSSRLDVVKTTSVPDMLPSCFLPGRAKDLLAPGHMDDWLTDRTASGNMALIF